MLQLPQLQILELDNCKSPVDYPFIARSSITSLSLKQVFFSLEDLLALLRVLPTVTHFSFDQFYETSVPLIDFFSLCPDRSESETLLPRLTHFDMRIRFSTEIDHDSVVSAFVEMVKSRVAESRLEQQLKSVRLSIPDRQLDHNLISPLVGLSKVGILMAIHDKYGSVL